MNLPQFIRWSLGKHFSASAMPTTLFWELGAQIKSLGKMMRKGREVIQVHQKWW